MSKRITTGWYIASWVVSVLALLGLFVAMRGSHGTSAPAAAMVAYGVMGIAGLAMLVMWIGALVKLGGRQAWAWFMGVLVLHLIGLGIIGMVAYAVAGPPDESGYVIRPTLAG